MQATYLELIQLTELYLLQQLPPKKSAPAVLPKAPLKPAVPKTPPPVSRQTPRPMFASHPPMQAHASLQPVSAKGQGQASYEPRPEGRGMVLAEFQLGPNHGLNYPALKGQASGDLDENLGDIFNLIKTHCPKLNLIEKPLREKSLFLLFEPKSPAEEQLVKNLILALNKEGFRIEETLENGSLLVAERSCLLHHPLKTEIKKNLEGQLKLGKIDVLVITSLADLITYPEKRRGLWAEILKR